VFAFKFEFRVKGVAATNNANVKRATVIGGQEKHQLPVNYHFQGSLGFLFRHVLNDV
jgi:hypothetical protein